MKNIMLVSFAFILAGCSATPIPYTPSEEQNLENARKIVEQIVMEQPARHRPEHVHFKKDYLALEYGVVHRTKGPTTSFTLGFGLGHAHGHHRHHFGHGVAIDTGNKKTTTKFIDERIYYSSIKDLRIAQKRNDYIVSILGNNEKVRKHIYMDSKRKAERFVDAMTHFIKKSSNLFE